MPCLRQGCRWYGRCRCEIAKVATGNKGGHQNVPVEPITITALAASNRARLASPVNRDASEELPVYLRLPPRSRATGDNSASFTSFLQNRAARREPSLHSRVILFEAWLATTMTAVRTSQPVIDALHDLAASCEIFFMAGNRDFLLGEDFAARAGMTLLEEPHILQLEHSRVVLVHGDSLCTDDHDYQKFRAMVRDPAWHFGDAGEITDRSASRLAARLRR